MINILFKHSIQRGNVFEGRKELATIISLMLSGNSKFNPYMPNAVLNAKDGQHNEATSDFWSVDQNNNWWVHFFDDNPNRMTIKYRYDTEYNDHEQERAFAGWLKVRLRYDICVDLM